MEIKFKIHSDKRSMVKQVQYALAVALTRTLQDGAKAATDTVKGNFTLRNNWVDSAKYKFRIKSATKTRLSGDVYTNASWLIPFDSTEVKVPKGKRLAIPVIGGSRTTFTAKIPKRLLPSTLGGQAFILPTKVGPIMYARVGRGKKKKLKALYFMDASFKVGHRDVLFAPVEKTLGTKLILNYNIALAEAIRTAR